MNKKKAICILCNIEGEKLVLNDLPMRKCFECGLIWRETFDIPVEHYKSKEFDISNSKIESRLRNSQGRIKILSKYAVPNHVCDIGCGEGLFLRVLKESGYKNNIGIEPSRTETFKDSRDLEIYKGTIDDVCNIIKNKDIHIFTMFHLIEHLSDPIGTISRLRECMVPGDYLMVETPDINSYIFKASNYKHPLIYPEHLFYYNRTNLGKLLKSCGLKMVASGKRGFDQKHMSIRNSMERLGLAPYSGTQGYLQREQSMKEELGRKSVSEDKRGTLASVRAFIRTLLNLFVTVFGRADYQWIIVKKV